MPVREAHDPAVDKKRLERWPGIEAALLNRSHQIEIGFPRGSQKERAGSAPALIKQPLRPQALRLDLLRLQNLAAAIHAALQVDMVRATQFAGILIFDIGRRL